MTQKIVTFFKQPISRKIGSLSAILLSFIFIVIVYSVMALSDITKEMREMAEVDIPLREAAAEIGVMQLELHLMIEKIRLLRYGNEEEHSLTSEALLTKYKAFDTELEQHISHAVSVIDGALEKGLVVDELIKHQESQSKLKEFQTSHSEFSEKAINTLSMQNISKTHWGNLETHFDDFDSQVFYLLSHSELLLENVAANTQRHVKQFLSVNIALGISAFLLGIYISFYIISSIQRRFSYLHEQLNGVKKFFYGKGIDAKNDQLQNDDDEFSRLSNHIQSVVDSFVTELNTQYEVEEELLKLAITDKLTGAFNRHKWDEVLNVELNLAKRGQPFSVITVDLDYFKLINDQHGHSVGDDVLKAAVTLMKANIRESDAVFRVGGEEFVILTRNAPMQHAQAIAEKVRVIFSDYKTDELPAFTASFGIAEYAENDTGESLSKRADDALYKAKNSGRNCVVTS